MKREEVTGHDSPNPSLWVQLAPDWTPDPALRWLIAGSARTHRGHFHVCSEIGDHHRSVNLGDVIDASPEAMLWLDGFLYGQQATLWEFLGEDIDLLDAADDDDEQRFIDWNRRFREQGFGPSLRTLPRRDPRLAELGTPTPWCYVGDLFRVWVGPDWTPAKPQPTGNDQIGWFWPGSLCEEIGEHDWSNYDWVDHCGRCHRIDA